MTIEVKDINGVDHSFEKEDLAGVEFNEWADVILLKDGRRIGFERNKNMFHVDGVCDSSYLTKYFLDLSFGKQEAIRKYKKLKFFDTILTVTVIINAIISFWAYFLK